MELQFTKMQGCGNDYIYLNCMEREIDAPEALAVRLSDRHFGVGGDGLVLILPSQIADARMRMFNLDGSEGRMCGNAIRCVSKYLFDNGIVSKRQMTIETKSGVKELFLETEGSFVTAAKVNMGPAGLAPENVPVNLSGEKVVNHKITIGSEDFYITCVSMGNPHAVIFCADPGVLNLPEVGPKFEGNPIFPQRVNTEFVKVIVEHTLEMRVWERGSGETLACGTGACASAVAAVLNGYCQMDQDITVRLLGGELVIRYTNEAVYMTGACEKVFEGTIQI